MVTRVPLTVFVILVLGISVSFAEPQIFFGEDTGQGDSFPLPQHPNSDAAFVEFINSVQEFYLEDFESLPAGANPEFTVQFGSFNGLFTGRGEIRSVPNGTYAGTHPISGDQFYLVDNYTAPFTVTFSAPVEAIGFYLTDVGDIQTQITVILEGNREFIIPSCSGCTSGGVLYFGVVSEGEPFQSVTLRPDFNNMDGWGVDDLIVGWVSGAIPTDAESWGAIKSLYR